MSTYKLTLYVAGTSRASREAVTNIEAFRAAQRGVQIEVEIVDVLESPERADDDRVMVTPTLVRRCPLPPRRIMGCMNSSDEVFSALGIPEPPASMAS